jgi:hypothetical protein
MYNVYKKYKKESSCSKLITKSNDNVLLDVYYYVRLFTILVSMLFHRFTYFERCYVIV